MTTSDFKNQILLGIPDNLLEKKTFDKTVSHAPKRKDILTSEEKKARITQRTPVLSSKTSRSVSA
jgi:hypothetical protein